MRTGVRVFDSAYCDGSNDAVEFSPGRIFYCRKCGRGLSARRLGKTKEGRIPWHKKASGR